MKAFFDTVDKIQKVTDKILMFVIIVLFLLMFGVTNLNVFMRYFLNSPVIFAVEMGRYCFVSIIFLGAIFTTKYDRHIHVDFFTGLFPKKIQGIVEQFGRILMAGFFAILTFHTCRMAAANTGVISSAMKIPMALPYAVMAVGCAGITIENVLNILRVISGVPIKSNKKKTEEEQ